MHNDPAEYEDEIGGGPASEYWHPEEFGEIWRQTGDIHEASRVSRELAEARRQDDALQRLIEYVELHA